MKAWWESWRGELLDRARGIVKHEGDTSLQTTLPVEHGFTTHPAILAYAYRLWRQADFRGTPPSPNEILEMDMGYLDEVCAFAEIVQYVRDETESKVKNG